MGSSSNSGNIAAPPLGMILAVVFLGVISATMQLETSEESTLSDDCTELSFNFIFDCGASFFSFLFNLLTFNIDGAPVFIRVPIAALMLGTIGWSILGLGMKVAEIIAEAV